MTLYQLAESVTFGTFLLAATRKLLPAALWEAGLLIGVGLALVLASAFASEIEAALGQPQPFDVAGAP